MKKEKAPVSRKTRKSNKDDTEIRSALRNEFYKSVAEILRTARSNAYRAVNFTMVEAYWNVGRMIVEDEQGGEKRAAYGKRVPTAVSRRLSAEFGKGFAPDNLRNFRQFYLCFSKEEICDTVCSELSWSHFRMLMRIENKAARAWYANESATQGWSATAPCWKARVRYLMTSWFFNF